MRDLSVVCRSGGDGLRAGAVEGRMALAAQPLGRVDGPHRCQQLGTPEQLRGLADRAGRRGSFPAEVSALETDARAMAHQIEEFGRPGGPVRDAEPA